MLNIDGRPELVDTLTIGEDRSETDRDTARPSKGGSAFRSVIWMLTGFSLFAVALTSGHVFSVDVRLSIAFMAGHFMATRS